MQQQIESVIFASEEAITLQVIRQVTGVEMDSAALQEVVEAINREYLESGRPFSIHRIAGGYRMLSREEFAPLLRKLQAPKIRRRLSRSILEVLSVVAYHQPVTRGEIQQIRGVSPDYAIDRLMERGFIEVQGRADTPGRPLQYGTTKEFLDLFHLSSLKDLPKLREIKEILREHEEQEYLSQSGGEKLSPAATGQESGAGDYDREEKG
ncbi:SMC-Scp complex subunit ScpB [Chlorobium phaeovibrioides]|uniref:SMC-Scp complex subunit ScpB n=1 Tax=Chlorobium phaeovibrioides TaxID=1094 RepID=A0A3S0L6C3_CHLPH|nr:SMC-Scp complex subunit ScpB [Chlorobium phaeovibrioides]MWV53675.1 SMC-Scp complex subunit ScpB [Chlorobium phaeovibrioides]QEQ57748.1 SMC-Scp complex subunit ScpB [Chlorobium phaeovibrioides]RTY35808.1 SMC-Scp complex subunit ScpB [Chlorobium phaeovibrioides]RTY39120.1 SMC-Scp complex subunit ScpB [Chlorobium phaeovibrioides]